MKRNPIITFLSLTLVAMVAFWMSSCKDGSCELDPPKEINHSIITPDSVVVTWTSVANAAGYQVLLIDSNNQNTVVDSIFTTDTVYTKGDLTPGNTYRAEVRSACSENNISKTPRVEKFTMPEIIMGDVVVMMEVNPGMDDCECQFSESRNPYVSEDVLGVVEVGERRVYRIVVSHNSGESRQFKIAFSNSCSDIRIHKTTCGIADEIDDINLVTVDGGVANQGVEVNVAGAPEVLIVPHYAMVGTNKFVYLEFRPPLDVNESVSIEECFEAPESPWDDVCP